MRGAEKFAAVYVVFWLTLAASTERGNEEDLQYNKEISSNYSTSPDASLVSIPSSMESGPLDSHEAMNNREIPTKMREKRSYEFLMGLINNNSRYEVTKVDPAIGKQKPETLLKTETVQDSTGGEEEEDNNVTTSELLLELMVRIAAHPNQWEEVHELLQKLDEDLTVSKDIVGKLNAKKLKQKTLQPLNHQLTSTIVEKQNPVEKKKPVEITSTANIKVATTAPTIPVQRTTEEYVEKIQEEHQNSEEPWLSLDKFENIVKFVNNNNIVRREEKPVERTALQNVEKTIPSNTYHKNFAYHRVTGTPFNLNKNPMAYIAVSMVAPKSPNSKEDDVALENELHQLKPWSQFQHLNNLQSTRLRRVIQTDEHELNKSHL